jgi:predicted RNA-binding protein with PIN domain
MQEVIVDGYNLLRSDPELMMFERFGLEYAREAVITRLLNATGLRSVPLITVVFDGNKNGYTTEKSERRANGRVMVIYSKLGETADEVIKRLLAQKSAQSGSVRVITRDWEIKDAASQTGATSGAMKRRSSSIQKGMQQRYQDEDDGRSWDGSTRKKGPTKRPKKSDRKRGPGNDVYW